MNPALLRKLLRQSPEELVRSGVFRDPCWEGIFYQPQVLSQPQPAPEFQGRFSELVAAFYLARVEDQLIRQGVSRLIVVPPLTSSSPTPFEMDGERYASVEGFYQSLKYEPGSALRRTMAQTANPKVPGLRATYRRRTAEFCYGGRTLAVGQAEHLALVARALCAKVRQNPAVQAALLQTGDTRLTLCSRQPLGVVTPFVFMAERWRLRRLRSR